MHHFATADASEFPLPVLYAAAEGLFPTPPPKHPSDTQKGAPCQDDSLNRWASEVPLRVRERPFGDCHVYRTQPTVSLAGSQRVIFSLINNLKQLFLLLKFVMKTRIFQVCDKNV